MADKKKPVKPVEQPVELVKRGKKKGEHSIWSNGGTGFGQKESVNPGKGTGWGSS